MVRAADDPARHQTEEPGETEVGDDDHHAEQQRDRVAVDGGVRRREVEHAGRYHQAGAQQRRSRPVDSIARQPPDGDDEIGGGEDENGGDHNSDCLSPAAPAG